MAQGRRWTLAGAGTVLALAAVVALLLALNSPGRPAVAEAPPASAASTPAVPEPVIPRRSSTAPPLETVAPATPTTFRMSGPAFTIDAQVCPMPYVRPLDPPGEQHHTVCWVEADFGVAPSYPSAGTSYVLGHAWAHDPLEVLNPMSILAMSEVDQNAPQYENGVPIFPVTALDGYTIRLGTATGTLTYQVSRAFAVDKMQAGNVESVMAENTPNRIVLITCGVRSGPNGLTDVEVNVIAYADLVSSVSSVPTSDVAG